MLGANAGSQTSGAAGQVVDQLRALILSGRYLPGERIRQERLAEQLGVSRVPIREALRTLAGEGLVTLVANTGAWVTPLTQQQCTDLYRVRERLEPLLLMQSMPELNEESIVELKRLCEQVDATTEVDDFIRLDRRMHWLTYSAAPDEFLSRTVARLWNLTQYYRKRFTVLQGASGRELIASEHRLLVDAIEHQDVTAAATVLELHIRHTRKALAAAPEVFAPLPE